MTELDPVTATVVDGKKVSLGLAVKLVVLTSCTMVLAGTDVVSALLVSVTAAVVVGNSITVDGREDDGVPVPVGVTEISTELVTAVAVVVTLMLVSVAAVPVASEVVAVIDSDEEITCVYVVVAVSSMEPVLIGGVVDVGASSLLVSVATLPVASKLEVSVASGGLDVVDAICIELSRSSR